MRLLPCVIATGRAALNQSGHGGMAETDEADRALPASTSPSMPVLQAFPMLAEVKVFSL
jgi:hypothetical protein